MHNAGVILIFLQHNAIVSEKCMQVLLATRSRMYEVDKSGNRAVPSVFSMLLVFGSSNAGSLEKDI